MLFCYIYLTFMAIAPLDLILAQNSDVGFSYDRIPARPKIPERNPIRRPEVGIRPEASRPNRRPLPSQGGSRYLRRKKPGKKNLDKSILLELMGDDYQTSWMSDEKPQRPMISIPSHEVDLDEIPGRWAQERLFEQARDLNLTAEFSSLQPELLPFQDAIRSWLLKRSSCPVEFTWKDLGPTFWPRWVRKGECIDRKGSCSFPTGMHCVPAATTTVHILRWQCRDRKMTIVKKSASESKVPPDESVKKMRMLQRREAGARTVDDTRQGIRSNDRQSDVESSDDTSQGIRVLERHSSNVRTSDEMSKKRRMLQRHHEASARTVDDTRQGRRSNDRQSDFESTDDISQRIRVLERHSSNVRTSDETSKKRQFPKAAGRQFPKTDEDVMYRRRVADTNPEQQRRKKRCDWCRVPFPITIDCFCTC